MTAKILIAFAILIVVNKFINRDGRMKNYENIKTSGHLIYKTQPAPFDGYGRVVCKFVTDVTNLNTKQQSVQESIGESYVWMPVRKGDVLEINCTRGEYLWGRFYPLIEVEKWQKK